MQRVLIQNVLCHISQGHMPEQCRYYTQEVAIKKYKDLFDFPLATNCMGWHIYDTVFLSQFFNNVKVLDKEIAGSWGPFICNCLNKQSFIYRKRKDITDVAKYFYT